MPATPVEIADPPGCVTDTVLWQYAAEAKQRHHELPSSNVCDFCGQAWPCRPYRLAERADKASRVPASQWHVAHTMHADLASIGGRGSGRLYEALGARRSTPQPDAGGAASCA